MIDSYYRRLGVDGDHQVFASTFGTASNWNNEIQHGSPPLALLTKAIQEKAIEELTSRSAGQRIGRLTLDILGAIPVAPVRVRAWVMRPGARISLVAAEMTPADAGDDARAVARVTSWLLAPSDTSDVATDRHPPLIEGETVPPAHDWACAAGYLETVSWRSQVRTPGDDAAIAWFSPQVFLVDTEPLTEVQRLAMVVDSANGVGSAVNPRDFVFMNTDTTVHLHRAPSGNDFGLRARASIGPDGIGVTTAEIFDRSGFIGTSAQTLLIQRQ